MFKVGTMLKAREVRLSRKKPPYHPALIPGTRSSSYPSLLGNLKNGRSSMGRLELGVDHIGIIA
jgi:hypothetical protein